MKLKFRILNNLYPVLIVTAACLFLPFLLRARADVPQWWKLQTTNAQGGAPVFDGSFMYVGEQNQLRALDRYSGKEVWKFTVQGVITGSPVIRGGRLIFSTERVLYCLDKRKGAEFWRYEAPGGFFTDTDVRVYEDMVLSGDTSGRLTALSIKTGKKVWTYSPPAGPLSVVPMETNYVYFFGRLEAADGRVMVGSADGTIAALRSDTGQTVWSTKKSQAVSAMVVLGHSIAVAVKNSGIFVFDIRTGKEQQSIREKQPVLHLTAYYPRPPVIKLMEVLLPPEVFRYVNLIRRPSLLVSYESGSFRRYDIPGNGAAWTLNRTMKYMTFPRIWRNLAYFGDAAGTLLAVYLDDGTVAWKIDGQEKMNVPPVMAYRPVIPESWCGHLPVQKLVRLLCRPTLVFGSYDGNLRSLDAVTGKSLWTVPLGVIQGEVAIRNGTLYVPSMEKALFAVKLSDGKAVLGRHPRLRIVSASRQVQKDEIFELTIQHDDTQYPNPWTDVALEAVFRHGKTAVKTDGFYYDKNTWKVRFNPPDNGDWTFTVSMFLPDKTLSSGGSFASTGRIPGEGIRISGTNPRRFTKDGITIYNGIGIGDVIDDANCNGNLLDDFFVGDDTKIATLSSVLAKNCQGFGKTVPVDEYAAIYGSGGRRFNIFRWSVDNASFNLFADGPAGTEYLIPEGKFGDQLAAALKRQGYVIWMDPFSWSIPNEQVWSFAAYKYDTYRRLRYVMARYGAYVDIWEIVNESHSPDDVIDDVAHYIKRHDPQKRPVSVSWDRPDIPSIDIASIHSYEDEPAEKSDLYITEIVGKYRKYGKPIVFSEQGNKKSNWTPDSSLRMRVRAWTAFFSEAILIFWNTSNSKTYSPPDHMNSNLYIGNEERAAVDVLQKFTTGIRLTATPVQPPVSTDDIRSYALSSDTGYLAYFYHFRNQPEGITATVALPADHDATFSWIDPATGRTLGTGRILKGEGLTVTPVFYTDLALKITYDEVQP